MSARTKRPRELMLAVSKSMADKADHAEGSVMATKQALWAVQTARKDLAAAEDGLSERLAVIGDMP